LSALSESLKRRLFYVIAHTCFALYRWFPVFGSLRASIAVIHRDGKILVIERNDKRGVSLPGGIAKWREGLSETLGREVTEETGMRVLQADLQMQYHSDADVPCDISVYRAEVVGELKQSWEGSPRWMTVEELEPRLIESQRPVLKLMRKVSG
jgi:ADP-ribose pyrophosphatase YjhB (NUDIX family)